MGAQPGPQVERFLDALVPSEAEELVRAGDEATLRRALELEPGRADAAVPLARRWPPAASATEALELLANVAGSFAADGLAARLRLEDGQPELQDAFSALDDGEVERGLDSLIGAIPAHPGPGPARRPAPLRGRRAGRARGRAPRGARVAPQARRGAVLDLQRRAGRATGGAGGRGGSTTSSKPAIRTPISRTGCGGA